LRASSAGTIPARLLPRSILSRSPKYNPGYRAGSPFIRISHFDVAFGFGIPAISM
jgi:hypothetical protein